MAMKRVFFSFDFDNDQSLKILMEGQLKLPASPFQAANWSMKEAAPQRNWEQEAESRIKRSDVVVVLLGTYTHRAPGVRKEVAMARRHGKRLVQVILKAGSNPMRVRDGGRVIRWSWPNLKRVLS